MWEAHWILIVPITDGFSSLHSGAVMLEDWVSRMCSSLRSKAKGNTVFTHRNLVTYSPAGWIAQPPQPNPPIHCRKYIPTHHRSSSRLYHTLHTSSWKTSIYKTSKQSSIVRIEAEMGSIRPEVPFPVLYSPGLECLTLWNHAALCSPLTRGRLQANRLSQIVLKSVGLCHHWWCSAITVYLQSRRFTLYVQ